MLIEGRWAANVVRFPIEARAKPTIETMLDLAPDCRMIPVMVEAFDLEEFDPDFRHSVDKETADRLSAMNLPTSLEARFEILEPISQKAITEAIATCAAAQRAADAAYEARLVALESPLPEDVNGKALHLRADRFLRASAIATLEAHRLCEAASGQARAINFFAAGEEWYPFDPKEAGEWLLDAADAAAG
jgi:hypothetical protein